MRISDWSSDVCSSDLVSPSRQSGWLSATKISPVSFATDLPPTGTCLGTRRQTYARLTFSRRRDPCEKNFFRSEEHTSELQSLMRISYAVFCLKKKKKQTTNKHNLQNNTHNSDTQK